MFVRNRVTGLTHEVPAGHPALTDDLHDVLPVAKPKPKPEPEPEPELVPEPPARAKPRKPRARKST